MTVCKTITTEQEIKQCCSNTPEYFVVLGLPMGNLGMLVCKNCNSKLSPCIIKRTKLSEVF